MGSGGNSLFFGETGFKGSIPPYQRGGYPNNTAGYYGPNPMGGFPMANSNLGYPYSGGIGSFGNPYNQPPPPPPTPYQNPYQAGYGYSPQDILDHDSLCQALINNPLDQQHKPLMI